MYYEDSHLIRKNVTNYNITKGFCNCKTDVSKVRYLHLVTDISFRPTIRYCYVKYAKLDGFYVICLNC